MMMRKSISTNALTELAAASAPSLTVPSNPLEQIGFHSLLKVTPTTTVDCAITYQTVDFPQQLLEESTTDDDNQKALAACLATPSEPPAERTPTFRHPSIRWLDFCSSDEKMLERFHSLRRRIRKRMMNAKASIN